MAENSNLKAFRVLCELGSPGIPPKFVSDIRHCLKYRGEEEEEDGIQRYLEVND